jgi:DtxR family Mn-dependent transcriptional regulator
MVVSTIFKKQKGERCVWFRYLIPRLRFDMNETVSPEIEELLQHLYAVQAEQAEFHADFAPPELLVQARREGWVEAGTESHRLTPAGFDIGRAVMRRHRLAECLLQDVLVAKPDRLNDAACRFEHLLQHGLDERICGLLGHPRTCPHGRVIPEGECCRRARADSIREVAPLCDGKPGDQGAVAYLATRDNREVQKMMAMGILPGAKIELIQRFPSYVFQVGHSQFAVDRPLAEIIYVHWRKSL